MKPTVVLICGVPGSGKTHVAESLAADGFVYIKNDDYIGGDGTEAQLVAEITDQVTNYGKRVVTDCPFDEKHRVEVLTKAGFNVLPFFIVEDLKTTKERYEKRKGRTFPKHFASRLKTIAQSASKLGAPSGTSDEIEVTIRNKFTKRK